MKEEQAQAMSERLIALDGGEALRESPKTLDMMLTKLIWERALKSSDDRVLDAIRTLWVALRMEENK